MASRKEEVFPDMHHKMSKKIAQLTKVIYHLNTRNEDHQSEIDTLNQAHQYEIAQVIRDAQSKISKFKDLAVDRQQIVTLESKLEKLQKKLDEEKATATKELQGLKIKYESRESKLSREYQMKFDILTSDVDTMNMKFAVLQTYTVKPRITFFNSFVYPKPGIFYPREV